MDAPPSRHLREALRLSLVGALLGLLVHGVSSDGRLRLFEPAGPPPAESGICASPEGGGDEGICLPPEDS